MGRGIFYTMIGYVSGSVLYAKVFGKLFCQKDVTEDTIDGNPGHLRRIFLRRFSYCFLEKILTSVWE